MQETWVQSLGWEDPLEKGMSTHSSILAWRIPWTEEPGRLQSMGSQRVGHNWATNTFHHERNYHIIHRWLPQVSSSPKLKLLATALLHDFSRTKVPWAEIRPRPRQRKLEILATRPHSMCWVTWPHAKNARMVMFGSLLFYSFCLLLISLLPCFT